MRTAEEARELLVAAAPLEGVVVLGAGTSTAASAAGDAAGAAVLQLHADPDAAAVSAVRRARGGRGEIWAVVRLGQGGPPAGAQELFGEADAVVLDARSPLGGALGGTGQSFDWLEAAGWVSVWRRGHRLVVAGGLTPRNVGAAIRALTPDVVDVSSGVESAPGVKDPELMRRFVDAVRCA